MKIEMNIEETYAEVFLKDEEMEKDGEIETKIVVAKEGVMMIKIIKEKMKKNGEK